MVLRITFFIVLFCVLLSCEQAVENKGGNIPPSSLFELPLNEEKQIIYLSNLIQEQEQPQLLFYRARSYFHTHQYHLAKLDLDRLFNKSNEINEEYILLNAMVNSRIGDYERAIELINVSKISKNLTFENLPFLFELYSNKKMISAAKNILNQIAKQKNVSEEFIQISKMLVAGDTSSTRTYFGRNMLKQYQDDFLNRSYLNFALHAAPALQYQKVCLDLLRKYPQDAIYLSYWAKFLFQNNKSNQAEKVYLKAIELLPENQLLKFEFAKFYFQNKNYKKALHYFSTITSEQANYSEIIYLKASCLFLMGKESDAKILIDSLKNKSASPNVWSTKFYHNYLLKNDSLEISKDSLLNLNQ